MDTQRPPAQVSQAINRLALSLRPQRIVKVQMFKAQLVGFSQAVGYKVAAALVANHRLARRYRISHFKQTFSGHNPAACASST
jgi:uncharacterized membrane protein